MAHRRIWLEEQQIRQPFNQAQREIYRITAEDDPNATASQRYVGHLVALEPFRYACRHRG